MDVDENTNNNDATADATSDHPTNDVAMNVNQDNIPNGDEKKPAAKNLKKEETSDDEHENDDKNDDSSSGGSDSDSEVAEESDTDDSDDDKDDEDSENEGLSEYEKLRLERIKRNQARLAQLGLEKGMRPSGDSSMKKQAARPSNRRKSAPLILPKRSSRSRSVKKRINYSIDMGLQKYATPSRPLRDRPLKNPNKTRMVKWIYDEHKRISRVRKQNLKAAKRHAKKAQKEIKYWHRQMDRFMQKKRRHYDFERRRKQVVEEREELGGFTKMELLREIDRRTPELQRVVTQYDIQQREKQTSEEQKVKREQQLLRKRELERKMLMIDALDRFPKSLKEASSSLNASLFYRSPKDPPPPRRSKRSSDAFEVPSKKKGGKKKTASAGALAANNGQESSPSYKTQAGACFSNMVVEKPIVEPEVSSPAATQAPPKRKKDVRNVGGWISPPLAKEIDRSWLERESPLVKFSLNTYIPQIGDTILYYPGLHKKHLQAFPDLLGKKTKNTLRVPLWQRAKRERSKKKASAPYTWWNNDWLDEFEEMYEKYPIICRVERTHAEFPSDPYGSYKTVLKDGSIVWNLPKNASKKKNKTNIRQAVLLKPLTPVLPPIFNAATGFSSNNQELTSLPPKFTVSTAPSKKHQAFLVPFSWAFSMFHSCQIGDTIALYKTDNPTNKSKISQFHTLSEEHGSFRLNDKIPLIQKILSDLQNNASDMQEAMEQALTFGATKSSFSVTDASTVVEFLQQYLNGRATIPSLSVDTMEGSLLDLFRSTLPLCNSTEVTPNIYHARTTINVNRWDFQLKQRSLPATKDEVIPGIKSGLLHTLENALRIKIVCVMEDYIKNHNDANIFEDHVTEEIAPGYYNAVPIGMHLSRIMNRLKVDKRSELCYYTSVESVISDIQAIVDNCLLYNSAESDVVEICIAVITPLKRLISEIYQKHVKEEVNRIKADQDRRRFVLRECDSSALFTGVKGKSKRSSSRITGVPDGINAPYNQPLNRKWLQRLHSDGSWHLPTNVATAKESKKDVSVWLPQSGDTVYYSRSLHVKFVKGHFDSLAEEQCIVPRLALTGDPNGDMTDYDSGDSLEKQLQSNWLVATIVGVRTSFPRIPENEKNSFTTSSPVLVIGLRFPYAWSKGQVHFVCWRPSHFSEEEEISKTSRSQDSSFLRPAWIASLEGSNDECLSILPGFDAQIVEQNKTPTGIADSYSTSILKCMDVLKRRCLTGVDSDHVDPKLCLGYDEKGDSLASETQARGYASLPVFDEFLHKTCDPRKKAVNTRELKKQTKNDKAMQILSDVHFLPPWSMDASSAAPENKKAKEGKIPYYETIMAFPCLCLELICLRLKNGYYRQPAAVVNDLTEAYVSTVLYILSPAARKKNRLSTRKLSKYLHSSKGNAQPTAIIKAKDARSKTKKNLSFDINVPTPSKGRLFDLEDFNEEEKTWIAKIYKVRKLYAMAIVCVTDTQHLKNIFGLPGRKEKKTQEQATTNGSDSIAPQQLQEVGVHHIRYLLSALGRDSCENRITSFKGYTRVKIKVMGKVVEEDKDEISSKHEVTIDDNASQAPVVETSVVLGYHEMERNSDLARVFIGQEGRKASCIRCQVYGNSMLTCRFTMKHSNPDFHFVENFKNAGGVDGLLRSALPAGYTSNAQSPSFNGKPVAQYDGEQEEVVDPTENLKKAETSMKLADYLFQQAQILIQAPVTLGKDFVKLYFPVDPTDGHYIFCIRCGRSGDLICCEGCPTVVHADCIGLGNVPDGDWFCQECVSKKKNKEAKSAEVVARSSNNKGEKSVSFAEASAMSVEAVVDNKRQNDTKMPQEHIPPKTPYPAYFQFANARRAHIRDQNPGASNHDISRILSNMWKDCTPDFRQKFIEEETKQREAYRVNMKEYKRKTLEDFDESSCYTSATEFMASIASKEAQERAVAETIKNKLSKVSTGEGNNSKSVGTVADGDATQLEGISKDGALDADSLKNKASKVSTEEGNNSGTLGTVAGEDTSQLDGISQDGALDAEISRAAMNATVVTDEASKTEGVTDQGSITEEKQSIEARDPNEESSLVKDDGTTLKDCKELPSKELVTNTTEKKTSQKQDETLIESESKDVADQQTWNTPKIENTTPATPPIPKDDFDYCREVQIRAKKESVAKECKNGKAPKLAKKSNAYCHICHNRSSFAFGFPCGHLAHNYCERHLTARLPVGHQHPYRLDHCPICSLNCECAACTRKLNNVAHDLQIECRRQSKSGTEAVFDDVLHRCATASGTRYESYVNRWESEQPVKGSVSQHQPQVETVPLPKKPASAYIYFTNEMRPKLFAELPAISFVELGRIMGERWREMSPEEKKKFEELSDSDKARYNKEMEEYYVKEKEIAKKNGTVMGDLGEIEVPQKPYPAYFQFANSRRLDVKRGNPLKGNSEISRLLSDMWKGATTEFRDAYVQEEMKQRKVYKQEMEVYNRKMQERYKKIEAMTPHLSSPATHAAGDLDTRFVDTSDIQRPQKPYPAYFQFANRRRLEIKNQNPGASSVDITRILSNLWKSSSDDFKATFAMEETKQRKAYKIAMDEYECKIRERYQSLGVAYPGSVSAAPSGSYGVDRNGSRASSNTKTSLPASYHIPTISDEVFGQQTRNLELLLRQLQAFHPAPVTPALSRLPSAAHLQEVKEPPVIPKGTTFTKVFEDRGVFECKITRVATRSNPYYKVVYEDGDGEEMTIDEILQFLSNELKVEYAKAVKEYKIPRRKKRGRPRKHDPSLDDGEWEPEQSEQPKKRGRPRKSTKESVGKIRVSDNIDKPKGRRGRPRKSQLEAADVSDLHSTIETPIRRRGRPGRKSESIDDPPARGRGRPRKREASPVSEEESKEEVTSPREIRARSRISLSKMIEAPLSPPFKRKQGRPRKSEVVGQELEDPSIEEHQKKKRGRPRKSTLAEAIEPKKKRGRPKKSTLTDVTEPFFKEKAKKKKGRPRKLSPLKMTEPLIAEVPIRRRGRPRKTM